MPSQDPKKSGSGQTPHDRPKPTDAAAASEHGDGSPAAATAPAAPAADAEPLATSKPPPDHGQRVRRGRFARWSRRVAITAGVLFCLYVLATWWLLPLTIRHWIVPSASRSIAGSIEVGKVRFHPFRLSLRVDELTIRDMDGELAFSLTRFRGTFALWRSITEQGWHLERVVLAHPLVRAERDAAGTLNFARIFARDREGDDSAAEPTTTPDEQTRAIRRIPHLVVDIVAVNDGTLIWRDDALPEPFEVAIESFNFTIDKLDTHPSNDNDFLIVARSDSGATLRWDATFFADPFSSHGSVVISEIPLDTLMPYAMRHTDAVVTEGVLTIELVYDFAPARTPRAAVLDLQTIVLTDFRAQREGLPLAELPLVRLEDILTDGDARSLTVRRVRVDDGALHVQRDEEGVLNLVRMLTLAENVPVDDRSGPDDLPGPEVTIIEIPETATELDAERLALEAIEYPVRQLLTAIGYLLEDVLGPWTLQVDAVEIENQSIDFVDRTTIEPVVAEVRELRLRAGPVRTVEQYRIPFDTAMRLDGGGTITLEGELGVGDGDLDVRVRIEDLALAALAPYTWGLLPSPVEDARLRAGVTDLDGRLHGGWRGLADFDAEWTGVARVSDLVVTDADGASMARIGTASADGASRAMRDERTGSVAGFEGTATLVRVAGDPTLLAALGLAASGGDDSAVAFEHLGFAGTASASATVDADGPDGDADGDGNRTSAPESRALATGTIEGRGLRADLPSMPLRSATLERLDAEIEFDGPLDRVAGARVTGNATLVALSTHLTLGAEVAIDTEFNAGHLTLDGTAALGVAEGDGVAEGLVVDAVGVVGATAFSGRRDGATFGADSFDADGDARVTIGEDAIGVLASGATGVDGVEADDPSGFSARIASARASGRAEVDLAATTTILLDGEAATAGATDVLLGADAIAAGPVAARGRVILSTAWPEGISERLRTADAPSIALFGPDGAKGDQADDAHRDGAWRLLAVGALEGEMFRSEFGPKSSGADASQSSQRVDADALRADGEAIGTFSDSGRWRVVAIGDGGVSQGNAVDGAGLAVRAATVEFDGSAGARGGPDESVRFVARGNATVTSAAGEGIELAADSAIDAFEVGRLHVDGTLDGSTGAATAGQTAGPVAGPVAGQTPGEIELTGTVAIEALAADLHDASGAGSARFESLDARGTVRLPVAGTGSLRAEGVVAGSGLAGERRGDDSDSGGSVALGGAIDSFGAEGSITLPIGDHPSSLRLMTSTFIEGVRVTAPGPADASFTVGSIRIDGLDLDDDAGTIVADSVVIEQPVGNATVGLIPDSAPEPSTGRPLERLADAIPYRVRVGSLAVNGGRIELFDVQDPTGTTMLIEELQVAVSELGTDGATMATIDASSRVQGSGRFTVAGTADLFRERPEGELLITLTGVPLPPFSALSGAYAGWRIEQGRVSTNIPVRATEGRMQGELGFTLDRIRLGERVQSPLAPSVPLDIGLALLRDRNDRVTGRVPFSGDMTDPRFSLGGIILQAFFGLFGQVVTAPFQLFASLFGSGEEDVSTIPFAAGVAEPNDDGAERIGVMGRALEDRPGLSLEIFGHYAVVPDGDALRPGLLDAEVLRRLRTSFPNLTEVGESLHQQVVTSIHVERIGPPAATFAETEAAVLRTVEVPDELLRELAKQRAFAVLEALAEEYGIDRARLTATAPSPETIVREVPQVHLELF